MEHDVVTLAHGAGGKLSHALMEEIVLPELGNTILNTCTTARFCRLRGGQPLQRIPMSFSRIFSLAGASAGSPSAAR